MRSLRVGSARPARGDRLGAARAPGARRRRFSEIAWAVALAVAGGIALPAGAVAQGGDAGMRAEDPAGSPAAHGTPAAHLVIVSGLSGDPAYQRTFHELAIRMRSAARERGLVDSHLVWLAEDPGRSPHIAARSTAENVERTLAELAERAGPRDFILLLLLGHGSRRGGDSRLNLPGPDPGGSDFARMLAAFPTQTVAVVNAASASGGFVEALSGDRRVVVTATRSPRETNATRFPRHFVDAFAGEGADADRDGRVSLLEAFRYARLEVAREFEEENALPTEHALLDDDGDGEGTPEPGPAGEDGDGRLAARLFLTGRPDADVEARRAADDPELARLYARRTALETRLDSLRAAREEMEPEAYDRRLEELLVELSLLSRTIEERQGGDGEGGGDGGDGGGGSP